VLTPTSRPFHPKKRGCRVDVFTCPTLRPQDLHSVAAWLPVLFFCSRQFFFEFRHIILGLTASWLWPSHIHNIPNKVLSGYFPPSQSIELSARVTHFGFPVFWAWTPPFVFVLRVSAQTLYSHQIAATFRIDVSHCSCFNFFSRNWWIRLNGTEIRGWKRLQGLIWQNQSLETKYTALLCRIEPIFSSKVPGQLNAAIWASTTLSFKRYSKSSELSPDTLYTDCDLMGMDVTVLDSDKV